MKPILSSGIAALLAGAIMMSGCAKTVKTETSSKLPRDYRFDADSDAGYIYGKIIHNQAFGKKFVISFKNIQSRAVYRMRVEAVTATDMSDNFFLEFITGEWKLDEIKAEDGSTIKVAGLKKDEHREIIVEGGRATYVGTWNINREEFQVQDEQEMQDNYMRMNYKNVRTSNAISTLP